MSLSFQNGLMMDGFSTSYEFTPKMPGDPEENEFWYKPVWETEDEESLDPPPLLRVRARKSGAEPDFDHPLLTPLAAAQDAVARLEARTETASDAVSEGLRVRMAYLEAAGWLAHAHVWIHPRDLALRDNLLTGSYAVAAVRDRLKSELPSTMAQESEGAPAPSDITVNHALRLARHWRRLAETRSWRPLADADTLRETLQSLGGHVPETSELADYLASIRMLEKGPALIRAGRAAREWMNLHDIDQRHPEIDRRHPEGMFIGACLWREKGAKASIALPFWSAPELRHNRLALKFGVDWMAEFLNCVAAAAMIGLRELEQLREAENKGASLRTTARSSLPDAINAMLRAPVVTVSSLVKSLDVTPQAALGLLRQLMAAGLVREVTGRASWRAYSLA
jgi:hypothetical protein